MKKFVIFALLCLTAIFAFTSITKVSADVSVVGQEDTSYQNYSCKTPVYAENGTVTEVSSWGQRLATKSKVHVDGLTVKFVSTNVLATGHEVVGFVLGSAIGAYYGVNSNFGFAAWNGLFTQTRVSIASNHDHASTPIVYSDAACTQQGLCEGTGHVVCNVASGSCGFMAQFAYVEESDCYSIKIQPIDGSFNVIGNILWGDNPNYGTDISTTVYVKKDSLSLDDNGDAYLAFCGFSSAGDTMNLYVDYEDNNLKNFKTNVKPTIENAIDSYEDEVDAANTKANAETYTAGLGGWGQRIGSINKVSLDGLTIKFHSADITNNCAIGVTFGDGVYNYYDTSVAAITAIKGIDFAPTQTRIIVDTDHNYNNKKSIFYTDVDCTTQGFIADNEIVANNPEDGLGYSLSFKKVNDTVYSVEIAPIDSDFNIDADVMTGWTGNPNFNATNSSTTLYIKAETFGKALVDGKINFAVCGCNSKTTFNVKFAVSSNGRVLSANELYNVGATTYGYTNTISDEDKAQYNKVLTDGIALKENVDENAIGRDKGVFIKEIAEIDAKYQNNGVYNYLAAEKIASSYNTLSATFAVEEKDLTEEVIKTLKTNVKAYKAEFNAALSTLNAVNISNGNFYCGTLDEALENLNVILYVKNLEASLEAINLESETVGNDVKAVKEERAKYTEDTIEDLSEAHQKAIAARMAKFDTDLATVEAAAAVGIKQAYLSAFEALVTDDALSTYTGIAAAFEGKTTFDAQVTLAESDGELYTKYNAAVEKLYTKLEAFATQAIETISTRLDAEIKDLASFDAIRAAYKEINLQLLDNSRTQSATIKAAYDALTLKIEANFWYNFGQKDLNKCELTNDGVYFSQTPTFPSRINYNKELNLTEGVKIVLKVNKYAFYNGDKKEDGGSKGANNISINLLKEANSYKAQSNGINIIIWLFEVESNVQIVNAKDVSIANVAIATPLEGGEFVIEVKHGMYEDFAQSTSYMAYVITINDNEIVVADTLVAANELEYSDKCYLSIGSFADTTDVDNEFSLYSVNNDVFGKVEEEKPVVTTTEKVTTKATTQKATQKATEKKTDAATGSEEKKGCKGSISLSIIGVSFLLGACAILKKKKEN